MNRFQARVDRLVGVLRSASVELGAAVDAAAAMLTDAFRGGGKILVFGNGGSAADASHFAAEFVGRYLKEREGWPALALSPEAAAVTAIANDYGYERIFARQIEALGTSHDVALGLSTSGRSPNILAGFAAARAKGMKTVALTGRNGLADGSALDLLIRVPSDLAFEIQEVHKIVLHSICEDVECRMTAGRAS